MTRTRRAFLRRAAVTGLVAGVAGCSETPPTGTGTDTRTATGTQTATATPTAADPLSAELERVRAATERYRNGGIERARADGFEMLGRARGTWPLVDPSKAGDGEVSLEAPEALQFVDAGDGELVLGGVGYAIDPEYAPFDEAPPDRFSDEGADLTVSEAEGWTAIRGTFQYLFADGDGSVTDPSAISMDALTDPTNWGVTQDKGLVAGDEFDVDGDGEPEVLDLVRTYGPNWALRVWCYETNPNGLFAIDWPSG